MFAMYDDDGLNFRSSIDHLYDIHKVAYSQRIKNNTKDKNQNSFGDEVKKKIITKEAKNRYEQMTDMHSKTNIYHVDQIMSHTALIINDEKTIQECFDLMQEHKVQQLLIRKDTSNHLKGMVTKHDILNYIMEHSSQDDVDFEKKVNEIAQKNIITTDPKSDIRRVSKVMVDFNRNAIPVVNKEENILGVVTRHDILKAVASIPDLQVWA